MIRAIYSLHEECSTDRRQPRQVWTQGLMGNEHLFRTVRLAALVAPKGRRACRMYGGATPRRRLLCLYNTGSGLCACTRLHVGTVLYVYIYIHMYLYTRPSDRTLGKMDIVMLQDAAKHCSVARMVSLYIYIHLYHSAHTEL